MLGLTSICTLYILHLEAESPPLIWFPPVLWLVKSTRDFAASTYASTLKRIPLKKKKSSNPIYITFKYKYTSHPVAPCTQSKWCLTSQVCFQRPVPCLEVERPRRCAHIKRTFGPRCIFIPSLPPTPHTHAYTPISNTQWTLLEDFVQPFPLFSLLKANWGCAN